MTNGSVGVGHVTQPWITIGHLTTWRNLHTEEQIWGPGRKTWWLLQTHATWKRKRMTVALCRSFRLTVSCPICTFSHVFLEGAGHTERHLTESALVDVLPNTPMGLHVPGENLSVSVYNFYETLTWSVCCSGRSYRNTFDICTASPQCVTACGPSDWSSFWKLFHNTRKCHYGPAILTLFASEGQIKRLVCLFAPVPIKTKLMMKINIRFI